MAKKEQAKAGAKGKDASKNAQMAKKGAAASNKKGAKAKKKVRTRREIDD